MSEESFKKNYMELKISIDLEIEKFFTEKKQDEHLKKYYKILEDFMLNGGKRLRPIALFMTYKGLGGKENILRQSLAVEFIHNSSLIEDDIMDEDDYRRNKKTVYKLLKDEYIKHFKDKKYRGSIFNRLSSRFAASKAIILANMLYCLGEECITKDRFNNKIKLECMNLYNEVFFQLNEGQLDDILFEQRKNVSEKEYIQMVDNKSSALVMTSIKLGAVMAGAKKKTIQTLEKFSMCATLGFQIHDDLMDINPDARKGHELGSDIKQKKKTLLIIKALEKASENDKKRLIRILKKNRVSNRDVKNAIEIMHMSGAVDYCNDLKKKKIDEAKKWLKKAKLKREAEKFFLELANYMIDRDV